MGFDPLWGKMEHWPHFNCALSDPECPFDRPQSAVLLIYFFLRQVCIGQVCFEPIPLFILFDFFLVYCNLNIVRYFKELVVPAFVDVLFGYIATAVCFFEPFYTLSRLYLSFLALLSEYPTISLALSFRVS